HPLSVRRQQRDAPRLPHGKGGGHISIEEKFLHRHHVRTVFPKKRPRLIVNPLQTGRDGQIRLRPDAAVIEGNQAGSPLFQHAVTHNGDAGIDPDNPHTGSSLSANAHSLYDYSTFFLVNGPRDSSGPLPGPLDAPPAPCTRERPAVRARWPSHSPIFSERR